MSHSWVGSLEFVHLSEIHGLPSHIFATQEDDEPQPEQIKFHVNHLNSNESRSVKLKADIVDNHNTYS